MKGEELRRRQRLAARIALWSGAVALVSAALLLPRSAELTPADIDDLTSWAEIDFGAFPEVQRFQELLRIDTTASTGSEVVAAEYLARELASVGIESLIERFGADRANLWARLEGTDPSPLVLLSHLDVEPIVYPEAWVHDPFGGVIDSPWIYGRGAFDMKSVTIAQLEAMLALARRPVPPGRSILFLATSSEESGSDLGLRWILRQHPELLDGAWGVLTEGGMVEGRSLSSIKYWGIEVGQKRFVDIRACASRRDRIDLLLEDVRREGRAGPPEGLAPQVRAFFRAYAPSRDRPQLRRALALGEDLLWDLEALEELPPYLMSLLRSELHALGPPRPVSGGWEAPLSLHLLPSSRLEQELPRLLPPWMFHGVDFEIIDRTPIVRPSSLETGLYRNLEAFLREEKPGATVGPVVLPWTATDARYLRARGIPTYGFSPFFILTPDTLHIGTANEKIALPGFVGGVELYRQLVETLAD